MQNITDILLDYGVPYTGGEAKHGRIGWVQVSCPDCGDVSSHGYAKQYLGINLTNGAANCWRCGRKNTARVLSQLTRRPRAEIRARLDGMVWEPVKKAVQGRLVAPTGRTPLGAAHKAYLAQRGLDAAEIASLWGVEGIGNASGKWRALRWRLFIPIHHAGEMVSWTTRAIRARERMRYVSAAAEQEAMPHKDLLYGADYARHAIIIHEGPIDVWATGPGAVGTCGTGYTEAQLKAMSRYPVRAVCFDTEPEAQVRARALADALAPFPGTTHNVVLESGADAAEADKGEIKELRQHFLE